LSPTEIYRIALPDHSSQPSTAAPRRAIETVAELTITSHTHLVQAIYPAFKLIAFSHACFIDIFNWETKESVMITAGKEDLDELVSMDVYRDTKVESINHNSADFPSGME